MLSMGNAMSTTTALRDAGSARQSYIEGLQEANRALALAVRDAHAEGQSARSIAKHAGISHTAVANILKAGSTES